MPGGGQLKHWLNNVAQMHTHESGVSGKRDCRRGLLEEVHFGNANQADGLLSFVCTATGDPLGNASLLNRGASNASLEQGRKSGLLDVSEFIFFSLHPPPPPSTIICNGGRGNDIDQRKH